MQYSIRTLQRKRDWVELIRQIPEGVTNMPYKMALQTYHSLKATCVRENRKQDEYRYLPSFRQRSVTITKIRNHGESNQQRMQAE